MNKNIILHGVQLWHPHLLKTHSPFGSEIWEVQVRTTEEHVKQHMEEVGLNVKKSDEGYWHANVKRNKIAKNGDVNSPPTIVDAQKNPWDSSVNIGNGTIANLKLFSFEWKNAGKQGRSALLNAVQVVKLEEYKTGEDFDVL